MQKESFPKILSILLWLITIHSAVVGIALILLPFQLLEFFGYFGYSGIFFKTQGGVFHVVMAVAYALAAVNLGKAHFVIVFIIAAKSMATIFLLSYYIWIEPIWTVFFSAMGDGAMAIVLYLVYSKYKKSIKSVRV